MASPRLEKEQQRLAALRERLSAADDYRDLVENATDIIYTHDLNGRLSSVNKAAARISGYTREEALRMNILEWLDPESRELTLEMIRQKLGGSPRNTYEVTLVAKNDRRIALEVGIRLLFRQGRPVGFQGRLPETSPSGRRRRSWNATAIASWSWSRATSRSEAS